jgi:hypothetical protein
METFEIVIIGTGVSEHIRGMCERGRGDNPLFDNLLTHG